jgi:hypothetical protein
MVEKKHGQEKKDKRVKGGYVDIRHCRNWEGLLHHKSERIAVSTVARYNATDQKGQRGTRHEAQSRRICQMIA